MKNFFANKWSYNLAIGDKKFPTLDGAQIDGSALKSTIRFLEQKEDCSAETKTLFALMHSKDNADKFFNSEIFEGKPHLMPYGSFPESNKLVVLKLTPSECERWRIAFLTSREVVITICLWLWPILVVILKC